jgi:RNA polymerase sigma-70 factor (ECF subfamily)
MTPTRLSHRRQTIADRKHRRVTDSMRVDEARRTDRRDAYDRGAVIDVSDRSDEDLLVAIGDRDRGAFDALYHRHGPWLTVRLAQRCGDDDVVDQALQDTFMAVWTRPGAYRGSGAVPAWLWGIAVRRMIDQLRRRPLLAYRAANDGLVVSAEDEVLVGIGHGELGPALDRLSPELVMVVQATVLDGLTTREAARLLRIPTGTVKSRMARARLQLREALA